MHEICPQNGFILVNTAQKPQYGAFKSMREGQIDLVGPCPFLSTPALGNSSAAFVALKQPYLFNRGSGSNSSSSVASTLGLSPDGQVKELASEALSIQWASSLLQDVYDFVASYLQSGGVTRTPPMTIPQFRFIKSGLAITNVPGAAAWEKEVYLVEELIQSDGPWRKYINNNTSYPCSFSDDENCHRSQFLSFCQHVQYWRTGCLVFTSDFQGESHPDYLIDIYQQSCVGGDTLLTDPQIITHPCTSS
jgi:hypothetical protein